MLNNNRNYRMATPEEQLNFQNNVLPEWKEQIAKENAEKERFEEIGRKYDAIVAQDKAGQSFQSQIKICGTVVFSMLAAIGAAYYASQEQGRGL